MGNESDNQPQDRYLKGHEILFTRDDNGRVTNIGRVGFLVKKTNDEDPIKLLKRAVTAWVNENDSGWECWKQSGQDLNVGDLACYYTGPDMFVRWGIFRLHVDVFGSDNVTYYDRHLVDEDDLWPVFDVLDGLGSVTGEVRTNSDDPLSVYAVKQLVPVTKLLDAGFTVRRRE